MVLWISEMGSRRAAFSSSNSWCDAQRVTCRNWWKIDINWHWDHTGTMEDPKVCFIPLTGQNPQVKGKLSRTWGRPPVFRFQRCPESPAFHLADPSKVMKHKFLLVSRCFMRCPALNSWSPDWCFLCSCLIPGGSQRFSGWSCSCLANHGICEISTLPFLLVQYQYACFYTSRYF